MGSSLAVWSGRRRDTRHSAARRSGSSQTSLRQRRRRLRVMTGPPYPRRRRAAYPASTERTPPTRRPRASSRPGIPGPHRRLGHFVRRVDDEESTVSSKTWFITGTSRGFGREWARPPSSVATRSPRPPATPAPSTTSSRQYGDAGAADRARRHRPGGGLRGRAAGARALRPARRRRQQRRLRPVRHGRGAQRGRGPRPDRDQPVRRALGHPGGAALPARAGQRAHPPGLLDRRDLARSRPSGSTTRPSGRWRGSARRWPRRSPASASRSP